MYEEFNSIINQVESNDSLTLNEWGDFFYNDALEVIERFTDDDWNQLLNELPNKLLQLYSPVILIFIVQ